VALNFQTAGLEMDLNDGLFRQNGGCGFVLKPDFMRGGATRFSPEKPGERPGYGPRRLSIQVQHPVPGKIQIAIFSCVCI